MADYDFSGAFYGLMIICFLVGLACWGLWELIDWLWIDDAIKSLTPIRPEIKLIINDNVVDTVYVYRQPEN